MAGMKFGRDCEISTIIDVVPELIEIGPETFFADGFISAALAFIAGLSNSN
ncbi:MAG: hypothetical protein IPJ07_10715 [Acidobacteria bacterium]|nr:hypothetical protein [Acidobacteriota bacterium]